MVYTELEAREKIIDACHRLVASGLIARTWGNVSARLSDTEFLITPSGLAYDTLRGDQLVVVRTDDCSYSGNVKPSSEKGVHAACYRLRPETDFIVHTHQLCATAVGVGGDDLCMYDKYDPEAAHLLGPWVPCAAYGTPGTKGLVAAISASVSGNPRSKAFLMPLHGALCLGADEDDAFAVAEALERVSRHVLDEAVLPKCDDAQAVPDCGTSVRSGNIFRLHLDGAERIGAVGSGSLHGMAALHAAIYGATRAQNILFVTDEHIRAVSLAVKTLPPRLDDLAQIAGVGIQVGTLEETPRKLARKMIGRNALLLRGVGALCTGANLSDAEAVAMILSKGCLTERYALTRTEPLSLPYAEAAAQRLVYLTKYSKQKK